MCSKNNNVILPLFFILTGPKLLGDIVVLMRLDTDAPKYR